MGRKGARLRLSAADPCGVVGGGLTCPGEGGLTCSGEELLGQVP